MSIFNGATEILKMFAGAAVVDRVYQGANLLFEEAVNVFAQPAPAVAGYVSAWTSTGGSPSMALGVVTDFLEYQGDTAPNTTYSTPVTVVTATNYEFITDTDTGVNASNTMHLQVGTVAGSGNIATMAITAAAWNAGGRHTLAFNSTGNITVHISIRQQLQLTGQVRYNNTFVREA